MKPDHPLPLFPCTLYPQLIAERRAAVLDLIAAGLFIPHGKGARP
jgi:hypothetical protein